MGTDGSPLSLEAARRAAAVLPEDAMFVLVCAIPPRAAPEDDAGGFEGPLLSPEEADDLNRESVVEANAALAATAAALGPVAVEQRVEEGSPADVICSVAGDLDADVVVVGSHGKGALKEAVLGSVSRQVLHHCHRPVLVVPRAA
jgi:nucleotide-binding universal stress UspA family protein